MKMCDDLPMAKAGTILHPKKPIEDIESKIKKAKPKALLHRGWYLLNK